MYEEAIKTISEFLRDYDLHISGHTYYEISISDELEKALNTALNCIRKEQERNNPQPLTLKELTERVKKPVYVDEYYLDEDGLMTRNAGWDVIDSIHIAVLGDESYVEMKSGDIWPINNANVKFYDNKSKED